MADKTRKPGKISKGMPSAVLLSIAIHAALFFLAGILVVVTVVSKKEQAFQPPPTIERPKMNLKKPRVRIRKSSRPKATARITSQLNPQTMPSMDLPAMSGMGDFLGNVSEGFDMLSDVSEPTVFGSTQSIGNDFEGTFYDLTRNSKGDQISMSPPEYVDIITRFVKGGCRKSDLARFYKSPRKLYAKTFVAPVMFSVMGPQYFGEYNTEGYCWIVHSEGKLVCPEAFKDGIKFRFWGAGDDVLVVRVDGKTVLSACYPDGRWPTQEIGSPWQSSSPDTYRYRLGNNFNVVGDWITLKPGVPLDMEVLFGEGPGGGFSLYLLVEVEGERYPKGPQGNPILPVFKTDVLTQDQVENIHSTLVPGEASLTEGPVFCDYPVPDIEYYTPPQEPVEKPVFADSVKEEIRSWTLADGQILNARFVSVIGGRAVLEDPAGIMRKLAMEQLSTEDRRYAELARPPEFNIDCSVKSTQYTYRASPYTRASYVPKRMDYVFGARLKQTSVGVYNHELTVELFAIGEEIDGDNYILLDRQESRFTPTKENDRSHAFYGRKVSLYDQVLSPEVGNSLFKQRRGERYSGYMVIVTDERGLVIDYATSSEWLLDLIGELRRLPVGKHFDRTGQRVAPTRPEPYGYY